MVLGVFYITSANAVNKITKGGILPVLCQFGIKERIMFKCINRNENRNIGNNLVMNMMVLHIREKKNCCEKLGLRYLGVLQHAHDYNCTFEEAISQMLENKQKKEFVFRNRKWLSLDTCCDFYKINKYSVQQLQYQCGYTVQEALERSINHTNLLRFKYKGKIMHHFVSVVKSWEYLNAL